MMTIMVAKCFAKSCIHLQEATTPTSVQGDQKLRPCMGCRSQWIHTGCGLCSDCQTGNHMTTPMEAMKNSFCSQVDKGKIHKRSSDRSPLSIRQSQIAKRLQDSTGFKEGKENGTACLNGKRLRKPTTPPALTPVIKPQDIPVATTTTKSTTTTAKNSDTNTKKRKLSSCGKTGGEPIAKKARKVSTAPGGTPKKYASANEPLNTRKARVKKVVEVKMAEDGTHNPDRLLYHISNNQPVDKGEPEIEESYDWLVELNDKQTDDFVDLNEGEKAFFKLWNTHLHKNPCFGDQMMIKILDMFINENGVRIFRGNLYRNFTLHLSNFHQFGTISSSMMMVLISKMQNIIKDIIENPTAYPLTPAKVPIQNPYYKPKPVALDNESLTLHLSDDEDEQHHLNKTPSVTNSSKLSPSISSINKKQQSFWLKKSFRNPVVKSHEVDSDEELWGPRKKAKVSFANDIVVEEILDLNGKGSSNGNIHDVADLIKFISPRQRRCKS